MFIKAALTLAPLQFCLMLAPCSYCTFLTYFVSSDLFLIFPQGRVRWGTEQVQRGVVWTKLKHWLHYIWYTVPSAAVLPFMWKEKTGSKCPVPPRRCFFFNAALSAGVQLYRIIDTVTATVWRRLKPERLLLLCEALLVAGMVGWCDV